MCEPNEESPIRDKYHEILRSLKSIEYRLNVIEQAANNGMTPQRWQDQQLMRKLDEDMRNMP